jgi:hypothetical protein
MRIGPEVPELKISNHHADRMPTQLIGIAELFLDPFGHLRTFFPPPWKVFSTRRKARETGFRSSLPGARAECPIPKGKASGLVVPTPLHVVA